VVIGRNEIWWADLGKPRGSEPGFTRPVLVVSADAFNASRISTVVVVVITSNVALATAPGNVLIAPSDSGLPKPSVANVSQLMTLDKSYLVKKVRRLPKATVDRVEAGLRLSLQLP
jgi:mRNA interferase MazF